MGRGSANQRTDDGRGRRPVTLSKADRAEVAKARAEAEYRVARWGELEALLQARDGLMLAAKALKRAEQERSLRDDSIPQSSARTWWADYYQLSQQARALHLRVGQIAIDLDVAEGVPLPSESGDIQAVLHGLLAELGYTGNRLGLALRLAKRGELDVEIADAQAKALAKQAERQQCAKAKEERPSREKAVAADVGGEGVMRRFVETVDLDPSDPQDRRWIEDTKAIMERTDAQRRADQNRLARNFLLLGKDDRD